MKQIWALLFFIGVAFFGFGGAQAAEQKDVEKVIKLMTSKSLRGAIYRDSRDDEGSVAYGHGTTVVFIANGRRYTFYHSKGGVRKGNIYYGKEGFPTSDEVEKIEFISISVRLNGTSGNRVEYFSDNNLDGLVDFGKDRPGPPWKKLFHVKFGAQEEKGLEFRSYYQKKYDQALREALLTLR